MDREERYAEHAPPPSLAPWVRLVWTYACPEPSRTIQRIAPDGCPELILDIGAPYEEERPDGVFRLHPTAIFAGQMTRPMGIRPVGPVELVAVRFHPDGARDWLGAPLSTATDRRLDMVARLAGVAPPPGDPESQARVMTDRLEDQRREQGWTVDPMVRAEIEALAADKPGPARSAADQRALQRRFRDRVGISPRMLRSVLRFRRVFDHALEPARRRAAGSRRGWRPAISTNPRWRGISAASLAARRPTGPASRSNWPAPSRRKPTSPARPIWPSLRPSPD